MTPTDLLASLRARGVRLWLEEGDSGIVTPKLDPPGLLKPADWKAIKASRDGLITLLRQESIEECGPVVPEGAKVHMVDNHNLPTDRVSRCYMWCWEGNEPKWSRSPRWYYATVYPPPNPNRECLHPTTHLARVPYKKGSGCHIMQQCLTCGVNVRGPSKWVPRRELDRPVNEYPLARGYEETQA